MKRIRTGLRIPYELNTWLVLEAKKQGYSKNALILNILWDYLKKEEKKHDGNNCNCAICDNCDGAC